MSDKKGVGAPAEGPQPAPAEGPQPAPTEEPQPAPADELHDSSVVLDLDERPSIDDPAPVPSPRVEPYDPAKAQEKMRGYIALALLAILGMVVAAAFFYLWCLPLSPNTKEYTANLVTLLQIIFGPIVALVGTALGYYFGSKGNGKS